jgi:hypothetical protein
MVSAVIVETWIMCIYVYYIVQLLPGNPLCSYSGNLKKCISFFCGSAHSLCGNPNNVCVCMYVCILYCAISAWWPFM